MSRPEELASEEAAVAASASISAGCVSAPRKKESQRKK